MHVPEEAIVLTGKAASGVGKARGFTQLPWVQAELERKLGLRPWPGTFNVSVDPESQAQWHAVKRLPGIEIEPPDAGACVAQCYRVVVAHIVEGAIVLPHVEGYPPNQIEVLAEENVRLCLGLADGDPITLHVLTGATG
jgi:riboflavin kinase, archaea type